MSWVWKGIPIPTLVALLLLIVGGLLHLVGVATPYWHEEHITNAKLRDFKTGHQGLWATCALSGIDTFECDAHNEVYSYISATRALEILALLCGVVCIVVTGLWYFLNKSCYISATRALEILALLCGAVCIVVTGLWYFLKMEKYYLFWMIGALLSGFLAGLFGIIGIILYGAEIGSKSRDTILGQLTERTLSWSFALCTLSSCIAVIATVLIGLGSRMKTNPYT